MNLIRTTMAALAVMVITIDEVYGQAPSISYPLAGLTTGVPVTLSPTNTGGSVPNAVYGQVTTFAGSPSEASGYVNDNGTSALFNWPQSMVKDAAGNLYVADGNNNAIRMITPSGAVTTFAGSVTGASGNSNGQDTTARFNNPVGITIDGAGNLYVADYGNGAIREITPAGLVTTFYSTTNSFGPGGLCFDSSGNLIVAAQDASQIVKITSSGVATTVAGNTAGYANGTGTAALFNQAGDVKTDGQGNLYVTDFLNNAIRKITPAGVVTTYAGSDVNGNTAGYANGVGTSAVFNNPTGLAVGAGGVIYVADIYNNDIRRIMPDGTVTLLAGSAAQAPGDGDGTGSTALFNLPASMYIDNAGVGYISEIGGNRIKKVTLTGYSLSGTLPAGLAFDPVTGIISGTPTAVTSNMQFAVTAYNPFGFSTANFSLPVNQGLPNNPANDYDRNWVYVRTYDENGVEIGAAKNFFDNNGKATQAQAKNETTGNVLATQTIYDLQGRAVIGTLPAPTNNSAFAYKTDFVTSSNLPYSYLNFDGDPANTTAQYAKLNNPDAVDNTTQGTLGWYYSDNNTSEPYVAATGYPYSRGDFYHDGTGAPKRVAGIGSQLKMGMGHEAKSNSFQVQNELINYLAIRNQFFPSAVVGNSPSGMAGQALQTISTDQNGTSAITVTDLSGKNTLMTGRVDGSTDAWLSVNNTVTSTANPPDFEVSITTNQYSTFAINSNQVVNIYYNGSATPQYTGTGNNHNYNGISGTYLVTSVYPFSYTYTDPTTPSANMIYARVAINESAVANQYFVLTSQSAVTISGGAYTIWEMTAEQDITSAYQANHTLQPGYYKVVATAPTANAGLLANTVTVSYTNKYSDISYNYYNQLGQLIATIAPNGVQQLIANGYSSYTTAAQLPFINLYNYDLQGRLTSATTTDGGTSNYIYRTDGKIRFSQNAVQRNTDATGAQKDPSFVEKISYTNYDNIGRPIESGEYVIPNGTAAVFAGLSAQTALLDATDAATATVTGATKQSQVNTYYDLPDPSPAYSASLTGYVQDAGFLKGAVSYTSNANSTTWYNYDDRGRVTWTVKSISGLGYKTVDYTYNDQGNVTKVDYQKGTASERFIHYYAYDADGRLTNIQTCRDDVAANKVQQANYYYYLHGPLKRLELGYNLQGIDYVYTAQGWLKSMNTPTQNTANDPGQDGVSNSFANDAFGMQIEYFPGDYSRGNSNITSVQTGQQTYYNGNVNGISWQSNKPSSVVTGSPGIQSPAMYAYNYDAKYQLTGATWGTPSFTGAGFTATNNFNENNLKYDANGNITSLKRTGTAPDDFSDGYSYGSTNNQLTKVHDATKNSDYATYTYNEIGQLKSEVLNGTPNTSYYLQYDVTGKITRIYSDQTMTNLLESYSYDESGNRIKTINANGTTYYVYDASRNVMAIYSGTSISEVPVYGSNRLGTYFYSSSNYQYELRDNVGSVRVVINGTKNSNGQADIVTYNDYYPFGSIAQSGSPGYRYDYQAAYSEKDAITSWNNFQLRMYDGKIGRWLTTDPKSQFASPYKGMGNNPVNSIDPDGAFWEEFGNWLTGNGWISNAGVDFMNANPGSTLLGWSGNRKTGFAIVSTKTSSSGPDGSPDYIGPGIRTFNAVQDYTFNGMDVTFDYTLDITAGLRASAVIKGLEGFDINMGSLKLASYSWQKGKWDHIRRNDFEFSEGFSIDHEGIGLGGNFTLHAVDGKVESFKVAGGLDYDIVKLQANYDFVQKKFGGEVGLEGSLGVGIVATGAIKLVIEQHTAFHY
jgi:RHS repeat-associated protein